MWYYVVVFCMGRNLWYRQRQTMGNPSTLCWCIDHLIILDQRFGAVRGAIMGSTTLGFRQQLGHCLERHHLEEWGSNWGAGTRNPATLVENQLCQLGFWFHRETPWSQAVGWRRSKSQKHSNTIFHSKGIKCIFILACMTCVNKMHVSHAPPTKKVHQKCIQKSASKETLEHSYFKIHAQSLFCADFTYLVEVPEPWYLDAHDLTMNPSGEHKFTMSLGLESLSNKILLSQWLCAANL